MSNNIRNDRLRDSHHPMLIMSHRRSGLHIVRLFLYYIKYGSFFPLINDYHLEWESFFIHFTHDLNVKDCWLDTCHYDIQRHKAKLLIIRNFKDLLLRDKINEEIQRECSFSIRAYCHLILRYDTMEGVKKIIYFEDIISNSNILMDIINFFGIVPFHEKINAKEILREAYSVYKIHHKPFIDIRDKPELTKQEINQAASEIRNILGDALYEKYLRRYND